MNKIEQMIAELCPDGVVFKILGEVMTIFRGVRLVKINYHWQNFVSEKQKEELSRIIANENLNREETEKFVKNAFRDGFIPETGTAITKLLPPLNPFLPDNQYAAKKMTVIEKLKLFLDRFLGIINNANV